jgi:hypothetical protein
MGVLDSGQRQMGLQTEWCFFDSFLYGRQPTQLPSPMSTFLEDTVWTNAGKHDDWERDLRVTTCEFIRSRILHPSIPS